MIERKMILNDLKKAGRQALSLFLTLVMCLGMLNLTAFAAYTPAAGVTGNGTDKDPYIVPAESTWGAGQTVSDVNGTLNKAFGKTGDWIAKGNHLMTWTKNPGSCRFDEVYQVSNDFDTEGKVIKTYKPKSDSTISYIMFKKIVEKPKVDLELTLSDPGEVMLVHKYEDGVDKGVDWDAVKRTILEAAEYPDDLKGPVEVQYQYGDKLDLWREIDSNLGKVTVGNKYPVRVHYPLIGDPDPKYNRNVSSNEVYVTFIDRGDFTPPKELVGTFSANGNGNSEVIKGDIDDVVKAAVQTAFEGKGCGKVSYEITTAAIGENATTVKVSWAGTATVKDGNTDYTITVTDNREDYKPDYSIAEFEVSNYETDVAEQIQEKVRSDFAGAPGNVTVTVALNETRDSATVTVSWAGDNTYKPGSKEYSVTVKDNRMAITLTGSTASVDLVFLADGTLDQTASEAAAVTAVKALVPTAYRDDVAVTHDEIGEGEVKFTVTRQGNNTEKDLNAEVTVTFTDAQTESRITLKGDKTAFDVMQNGFTKVLCRGNHSGGRHLGHCSGCGKDHGGQGLHDGQRKLQKRHHRVRR